MSLHGSAAPRCKQPTTGEHESTVQPLLSSQFSCLPGWQAPALQLSPSVQALPSLQKLPPGMVTQPLALSQVAAVHTPALAHCTAAPAWHNPAWQASPWVHASPSLHGPFCAVNAQPSLGSQASAVHGLPSPHTMPTPAVHLPAWQASPLVQALPSSHPPAAAMWVQPPLASQLSVVQALLSLQPCAAPPAHLPLLQASFWLHALPSSHGALLAKYKQPWIGLQLSEVQGLVSSQLAAAPETQLPASHLSPTVHASPSLQKLPPGTVTQPLTLSH